MISRLVGPKEPLHHKRTITTAWTRGLRHKRRFGGPPPASLHHKGTPVPHSTRELQHEGVGSACSTHGPDRATRSMESVTRGSCDATRGSSTATRGSCGL